MKMNVFVINQTEDVLTGVYDAKGHRAVGLADPEEEIINSIDEQKMSSKKILATRFLTFLGNRRLTLEKLKVLPKENQDKLRKEFFSSI